MERVEVTTYLARLLLWCADKGATDLHAQADRRYAFRVDGKLLRIGPEEFPIPNTGDIQGMLRDAFSASMPPKIR